MEDCVQSTFLGNWVLVAPYLCSKFHIFNRPILEKYVFHIERGGGGALNFYIFNVNGKMPLYST